MKKSNLFSLITGIIGALCIAFAVVTTAIAFNMSANENSIGIIGGADEAFLRDIFVMVLLRSWQFIAFLLGVALVLISLFCLIFKKAVSKHLTVKTTITAILISATLGVGTYSALSLIALGGFSKHPVLYPCCIAAGVIALAVFVLLGALYIFKFRKAKPSAKGVIIDILTAIVYMPFMYFAFIKFTEVLSRIVNIILS